MSGGRGFGAALLAAEYEATAADPAKRAAWLARTRGDAATAVAELERPITDALGKASADGDLGRYTLVICDDTSGRIPARIVWRTLKLTRPHIAGGAVRVAFVPGGGGRHHREDLTRQAMNGQRARLQAMAAGGRALVVTDSIQSGMSVSLIAWALRRRGIRCDILAAFVWPGKIRPADYTYPQGTCLYFGEAVGRPPRVDGNSSLAGVGKSPTTHALRARFQAPSIREARRLADLAAVSIAQSLA